MTSDNLPQGMKTCDFCGETILAVAKKCRHCKSMLNDSGGSGTEILQRSPSFHGTNDIKETAPINVVRVIQEDANKPVCPKCHSLKTTFSKQGFGFGKAAVGVLLTGGIGLLAGGIGKNKILITCLSCGHSWKAG